jgi:hypothetical protein
MVVLNLVDDVDLFDQPFELDSPQGNRVSRLTKHDTACVVSLSHSDGRCVYVIGPHGAGWTFGAFLKKLK